MVEASGEIYLRCSRYTRDSMCLKMCEKMYSLSTRKSNKNAFLQSPDLGRPPSLLPAPPTTPRLLGDVMSPEARPGIG